MNVIEKIYLRWKISRLERKLGQIDRKMELCSRILKCPRSEVGSRVKKMAGQFLECKKIVK